MTGRPVLVVAFCVLAWRAAPQAQQTPTPASGPTSPRRPSVSGKPALPPPEIPARPAEPPPIPSSGESNTPSMTRAPGQPPIYLQMVIPLVGVLLGAVIAFFTNWRLKLLERRAEFALRNRREIYSPLYEEVLTLMDALEHCPFPPHIYTELSFGVRLPPTYGRFQYWSKVRSDDRILRVAEDVRDTVERILRLLGQYEEKRPQCDDIIGQSVSEALAARGIENRVSNLGEVCAVDVLRDLAVAPAGFGSACFADGDAADADGLYADVCSAVRQVPAIARTREIAEDLRATVCELEQLLRSRINLILRKYEGRVPTI